jgi:hypothetical protein
VRQARLEVPYGDIFYGNDVALEGNTVLVGRPRFFQSGSPSTDTGDTYVFVRSGAQWTQQGKLPAPTEPDTGFGGSVSISGDTALVGAPTTAVAGKINQGAAHVFVRVGTSWVRQATLVAEDGEINDRFGADVSVDGDTVLVGAPDAPNRLAGGGTSGSGAAYVFVRSGASWSQQAKLVSTERFPQYFGAAVSISGNTALVGHPSWQTSPDGAWSTGHSGSATVFVRNGTAWTKQTDLIEAHGEHYGTSVSIAGDLAVVGGPSQLGTFYGNGIVHVYRRTAGTWIDEARLPFVEVNNNANLFGAAVALSGCTVLVGAPGETQNYDPSVNPAPSNGALYFYRLSGASCPVAIDAGRVPEAGSAPVDASPSPRDAGPADASAPGPGTGGGSGSSRGGPTDARASSGGAPDGSAASRPAASLDSGGCSYAVPGRNRGRGPIRTAMGVTLGILLLGRRQRRAASSSSSSRRAS